MSYCDPYVERWDVGRDGVSMSIARADDLCHAASSADVTVLLQPHAAFDLSRLEAVGKLVLDTRGVLQESEHVRRL